MALNIAYLCYCHNILFIITKTIKTDPFQKTNITGVFACGDNSSMLRSVSNTVATGGIAGAMVNKELVDELF